MERPDKRRGAAVQDRDFLGVELDDQAVDPAGPKGGQQMFDGPHAEPVADQRRAVSGFDPIEFQGHLQAAEVGPAENDSAGRGREKAEMDEFPGMDADPFE